VISTLCTTTHGLPKGVSIAGKLCTIKDLAENAKKTTKPIVVQMIAVFFQRQIG
jgi:hypothetical protein